MAIDIFRAVIGVISALVSIVMSSVGFVLQRKAYLIEASMPGSSLGFRICASSRCLRVSGLTVYILASGPDVLAFALIPQIVGTTVESFSLVLKILMGRYLLNEKAGHCQSAGMFVCMVGAFLVAWFGPYYTENDEASAKPYQLKVVVYLIFGHVLMVVVIACDHIKFHRLLHTASVRRFTLPFACVLSFRLEKIFQTELGFSGRPHALIDYAGPVAICVLALLNLYLTMRTAQLLAIRTSTLSLFVSTTVVQLFQSICVLDEFEHVSAGDIALSLGGMLLACAGAFYLEYARDTDLEASPKIRDDLSKEREVIGAKADSPAASMGQVDCDDLQVDEASSTQLLPIS